MATPWLNDLNPAQRRAVMHSDGRCTVRIGGHAVTAVRGSLMI
ncbi:MAG: hypothetical protein AAB341_03530 [Planctomycetota bacterium]